MPRGVSTKELFNNLLTPGQIMEKALYFKGITPFIYGNDEIASGGLVCLPITGKTISLLEENGFTFIPPRDREALSIVLSKPDKFECMLKPGSKLGMTMTALMPTKEGIPIVPGINGCRGGKAGARAFKALSQFCKLPPVMEEAAKNGEVLVRWSDINLKVLTLMELWRKDLDEGGLRDLLMKNANPLAFPNPYYRDEKASPLNQHIYVSEKDFVMVQCHWLKVRE